MSNKSIATFLLLSAGLFACPKNEPATSTAASAAAPTATTAPASAPAPAPAPASAGTAAANVPAGIASADAETSGVKVVVQELKRTSGGTVAMKFTITNGSDKAMGTGYAFGDKDHEIADFNSVGGVHLVDEAGKKKYFVVRDTDGKCVCSQGVKDLKPGGTANLWARFPAPPDNVAKITVIVPHFQPMDDVPIGR
ncbi:MAG TPA: hypothetical protein VI670_00420 [Thermoanaerobaculia bacterium]